MSRVALVEDDRNILTTVSMLLEAEGFEVDTFSDGQTALDAFKRRSPGIAVLDLKMPRMDGMDLLQRLRQKSKLPVIFLTSTADEVDEVLGLRMGADDYVRKPFSQRLLIERIRTILRRHESVAAEATAPETGEPMVRGDLVIDPQRHLVTWEGAEVGLTVTEFLLLQGWRSAPAS